MARRPGRGWQALIEKSREKVEELRAEMARSASMSASTFPNSAGS
jgi:hypothetical protein